ncbi:succinate dehydrogenase hydrophobic membrane anchor protein [Amycolatopsis acidicola]|uniref:Succinate dehydrogenase hydrophobic membrane anchor protein n=1 Tax=Amycolatopsis acidicola TaxID=2596893 RepID=A0A5N0UTI4_9PSEU|nr:succinate dehydrogenase hydrophobic membrane anchor protein [Amycolatopsis acidicola]KAA9152759.1 succinate dehydrogenase hydrophobic membrane anchor protein [Amycolatopsis acidicola]
MTTTPARPAPASRGSAVRRRRAAYISLRMTGVLLAVLVLGHFASTHVITDVSGTDANFIDERWASLLWVIWDSVMLVAVLAHAVLGLWAVVADYSAGTRRLVIRATVFVVAGLLLLGGLAIIIVGASG